jgi:hypothetical protein
VDLRGGYQPKTPQSPAFRCGEAPQTYRDIRGNAFYCGRDDYIAWDAAQLFPQLNRTFGNVAPAIVLAHEMGHAVQRRAGVQAPSIVTELQADCFAGAWVRFARTTRDDAVTVTGPALDSAVAAVLVLRDQPGTPAADPVAHGLGFDRVNGFQTGYEGDAARCARLPAEGVVTTELPFRTVEEALTGGNLPYDLAAGLFTRSLDRFWTASAPAFTPPHRQPVATPPLPPCPRPAAYDVRDTLGYCPPTNTVTWADDLLRQAHRAGDFVTATLLSDQWGRAAQFQGGLPVDGPAAGLQRDCFTGAWVSTVAASGQSEFLLSAGDLDEVLATILASSFGPRGAPRGRGDAFERTAALRRGVLEGLPACT